MKICFTCTADGCARALQQNETEHLQENCDSKTPGHTKQSNGYVLWVHASHNQLHNHHVAIKICLTSMDM